MSEYLNILKNNGYSGEGIIKIGGPDSGATLTLDESISLLDNVTDYYRKEGLLNSVKIELMTTIELRAYRIKEKYCE